MLCHIGFPCLKMIGVLYADKSSIVLYEKRTVVFAEASN